MQRRCLVHVFAPQNMLPAASAVRWYGKSVYGVEAAEVTVILHMPGWNEDRLMQIAELVTKQAQSQHWKELLILTESEMTRIVGPQADHNDPSSIERFREYVDKDSSYFTEVYYCHDVVGHAAQLCMRAFPHATRITYGESMGLMEDKDYLLASVTGAGWDETRPHPKTLRSEPQATKAVLIMPADQTGDCLSDKQLFVVPKQLAKQVISEFQQNLPELGVYIRSLLQANKSPYYVFVINNITDSNFTTADKESEMYAEMIRAHVPQGATVILKGHPLSTIPIDAMVIEKIKGTHVGVSIAPQFSRYPLEIWKDLLEASQVISLSYCSISLEYLYDKPVIYSINTEIISKYVDEKAWNRFLDTDEFFKKQREALKTWDGKGVICSGKRISFPPTKAKPPIQDLKAAEIKNQEGIALFQAGKLAEAVAVFKAGLALAPGHSGISNNLGVLSWNQEKPSDAVVYFSLAHLANPHDRSVILNLFQILLSMGNPEAAKAVCFSYLQHHPEDAEIKTLWERA